MNYGKEFILFENMSTKEISIKSNNKHYKLGFETAFDILTKEQQLLLDRLFNYANSFSSDGALFEYGELYYLLNAIEALALDEENANLLETDIDFDESGKIDISSTIDENGHLIITK